MAFPWATSIPKTSAPFLVPLMHFAGVYVMETNDRIWIQGEAASEKEKLKVDACLQRISGAIRFERLPDNQLIQSGNTLPSRRLPELSLTAWILLTDWIAFQMPLASLVGKIDASVSIEIVRRSSPLANQTKEPSILICRIEALVAWADHASEHRIRRLSFACKRDGTAIVKGTPLPSVRGQSLVDHGQIAIESGYSWSPAVSIETLKQIFRVQKSQLLLCRSGKSVQAIELSDFAAATRAGIRLTGKQLENLSEPTEALQ